MLEVRVLGNQPEPTLCKAGLDIIDFEVRTRDEEVFEQGKFLIDHYIDQNPELQGCQLIIDDPGASSIPVSARNRWASPRVAHGSFTTGCPTKSQLIPAACI